MWTAFLGKHIKLSLAEIVLALIPSRICNYQFYNRHDSLTLCNTRMVTFKLVAVKEVLMIYSVVYFVPVIRIRYSYSLFVVHLFCQLSIIRYYLFIYFVRCSIINFASFSFEFFLLLFKRKRTILILNHVQVFRSRKQKKYPLYLLPVSTSSSRVNKHHTADSTDFVLV